jgi:ornithine carbamoyltransferase
LRNRSFLKEGAHVTYLDPGGSQLGHKESIADTARVLGRMYDAIEFRGSAHSDVEELAAHAGVPVYNGLTDEWHPTQMLADFLTMRESGHQSYDAITYTYMGDARTKTLSDDRDKALRGSDFIYTDVRSPASIVFDQAENRLHAIKAILVATIGSG